MLLNRFVHHFQAGQNSPHLTNSTMCVSICSNNVCQATRAISLDCCFSRSWMTHLHKQSTTILWIMMHLTSIDHQ